MILQPSWTVNGTLLYNCNIFTVTFFVFKFLTTIDFFKDEVKTVWLFEVFNELDNIFVTLAMVERLDLLQHSRPKILGKTTLVTKTVVSIGGPLRL